MSQHQAPHRLEETQICPSNIRWIPPLLSHHITLCHRGFQGLLVPKVPQNLSWTQFLYLFALTHFSAVIRLMTAMDGLPTSLLSLLSHLSLEPLCTWTLSYFCSHKTHFTCWRKWIVKEASDSIFSIWAPVRALLNSWEKAYPLNNVEDGLGKVRD